MWTRQKLKSFNIIARKKLTLYEALHRKSDVDRLYVNRKVERKGEHKIPRQTQRETAQLLYEQPLSL